MMGLEGAAGAFGVADAVELTAEEVEVRAQDCYELEERIKASLRVAQESVWDLAEALYKFDEANGWSALGYDKLGDWLAQPEVGISRSHFYRLVSVYHEMVVLRQVDQTRLKQIEPQKLQIVLPSVKSGKVQLEDALDDAEALGRRDLRERYFKRPDPADEYRKQREGEDSDTADVVDAEVVVELNPVDDTPVWAAESKPDQNDHVASGQLQEVVDLLNLGLSQVATDEDKLQAMGNALVFIIGMFPEVAGDDA